MIAREIGNRQIEGNQLGNLGIAYEEQGDLGKARQHWQDALKIFEEIKSPMADRVRKWLEESDTEQYQQYCLFKQYC